MLFHRICYWANGKRSVIDIVKRLEIELYALKQDTSISRTSTDVSITESSKEKINLQAVLYIVEKLVKAGYLRVVG